MSHDNCTNFSLSPKIIKAIGKQEYHMCHVSHSYIGSLTPNTSHSNVFFIIFKWNIILQCNMLVAQQNDEWPQQTAQQTVSQSKVIS